MAKFCSGLLFLFLLSSTANSERAPNNYYDGSDDSVDCLRARLEGNACAVLYDDEGCGGWDLSVPEGYTELNFWKRNDAEAIVVKAGCIFVGKMCNSQCTVHFHVCIT